MKNNSFGIPKKMNQSLDWRWSTLLNWILTVNSATWNKSLINSFVIWSLRERIKQVLFATNYIIFAKKEVGEVDIVFIKFCIITVSIFHEKFLRWKNHRLTDYPKLERTYKNHQLQFLAPCRNIPNSVHTLSINLSQYIMAKI